MADLGSAAARGAAVTFAAQLARVALQMGSIIVLARLLAPEQYGLMAIVLVFVGVGEVFRDFGLSTAAVRAPTVTPEQRSNLFWINLGIGASLALALVLAAPVIARAFDEPAVAAVARGASVVLLLNGMVTQYRADLVRRMRFGVLAVADVGAQTVAIAAAIGAAWAGAGVWALVLQQVLQAFVLLCVLVVVGRWRPGRPRRRVPMRDFWQFGWNLVASQLLGYLGNNIDSVVLGWRLGPAPLGLYDRGYKLVMTPVSQVRAPSTTVALPVLARLRDEPARFASFVARGQLALAYPVMIGAALLVGTAAPASLLLLGPGWAGVGPVVRLLAASALMQTLAYVGYWVYLTCGLTPELLRFTLVTISVKIVLVLVGSQWGVVGVAAGFALAHTLEWPLSIAWLARLAPIDGGALARGAVRIVVLGAAVAGAAHVVSGRVGTPWPATLAGIAAGLVVVAAGLAVPRYRRDAREVAEVLRRAVGRQSGEKRVGLSGPGS